MATLDLQIGIEQSKDCKNFYFSDTTALYNALTAPHGYDPYYSIGVNPSVISPQDSLIFITKPDGTVVSIQLEDVDKDITRLETEGKNLIQRTITYADLGYASQLDDGIYKFVYWAYNDTALITYVASCYIVQDCQTCCCLDQKLAKITFCTNCDKETKLLFDLYLKRDSARMLAACGDYVGAQEALTYISNLCGIKTCDSCGN